MPWFQKKAPPQPPDSMSAMDLVHEAKVTEDPVYAYACLKRAEILAPDSLDVQRALLLLGRLHERDRRPADYALIKCYLLHAFEHPEKHTEEELERMARELFDDKRLQTCLSLAPDAEAFLEGYLGDLSAEYMRVFVAGESSHAPRVFGMSLKNQMPSYLARPAADIIRNAMSSAYLSAQEQRLVARAFYKAFYRQMNGDTKALDKLLGAEVYRALA
ncbi:MAG: hypothetical protein GX653_04110 [Clostridiales bacterium]|nr:hypothetical protein [Clostridiales bacterium]